MKICIIGWYGTETIGDRAILAGIFNVLSKVNDVSYRIGCLDTLLTERTLLEDYSFYKECANNTHLNIDLFDSRIKTQLDNSIDWADWLIIGGGPLMELAEMYMLRYAFQRGKKKKKRNIISGCGFGPFQSEEYRNVAIDIVSLADCCIWRDKISLEHTIQYSKNAIVVKDIIDPAVIAANYYRMHRKKNNNSDYIVANFRDATGEYTRTERGYNYYGEILENMYDTYKLPVVLVPMHSFVLGGDDRYLLNRVKRYVNNDYISVCNNPPTLEEVMALYQGAKCCLGMRFHSVLLQTILNGNNYILDYTDPKNGKTIGLLRQLDIDNLYDNRYLSLINNIGNIRFDANIKRTYIKEEVIDVFLDTYTNSFKMML